MIDSHSNYHSQEDAITDQLTSPQIIEQQPNHHPQPSYYNPKNQEHFFQSLGLPADLSDQSMQNFNYQPSQSHMSGNMPSAMAPNNMESPFMEQRSNFVNPSSQQVYKSMFANTYGQKLSQPVKQMVAQQPDYNDLNNSSLLQNSQKETYQTAQFKPGFGGLNGQSQSFQTEETSEILTITIEIGPGQNETIAIKNGDNPLMLAREFSRKHGIGSDLEDLLAEQIRLNIDQVKQDQQTRQTENRVDTEQSQTIQNYLSHPQQDSIDDPQFAKPPTQYAPFHQPHISAEHSSNQMQYDEKLDEMSSLTGSVAQTRPAHSKNFSNHFEPQQFKTIQPNQLIDPQMSINDNMNMGDYQMYHQSNAMPSLGQHVGIDNQTSHMSIKQPTPSSRPVETVSLQHNADLAGIPPIMDPQSNQYRQWYQGLSNNLSNTGSGFATTASNPMAAIKQTRNTHQSSGKKPPLQPQSNQIVRQTGMNELQDKPFISDNSNNIMMQKRMGNTLSSTGRESIINTQVHNRLYRQALAKQKANKNQAMNSEHSLISQSNVSTSLARDGRINSFDNRFNPHQNFKRSNSVSNIEERRKQMQNGPTSLNSTTKLSQRSSSYNYGHKLYEQGVKRKEEMRHHIQRAKSEQDRIEMELLSFQPQINQVSRQMDRHGQVRAEDNLINYGKAIKEKKEEKRVENMMKEVEGLNFQPQVCKLSSEIVRQKRSHSYQSLDKGSGKFESLYQDACRRQERQTYIYSQCVEADCTFQPDVEKTKFYNFKNQSLQSSRATEVFDRLSHGRMNNSYDRSKLMMQHSKNLTNDLFDPETGQELFKPKVGRGPRGTNYRPGVDLYEHAYYSREKKDSQKKEKDRMSKQESTMQHSKKLTNQIVNNKKLNSFIEIFQELDNDEDGLISAYKINITSLEPQLLQILSPLFIEMEELGMTLNLDEFIDATSRLYSTVSLPEKNTLTRKRSNSARQKNKNATTLFKPQINPVSKGLANKRKDEGKVSERLYSKHNEYLLKRQQKKYESQDKELLGCTFKPNLSLTNKSSSNLTDNMGLTGFSKMNIDSTLMNTKDTYDLNTMIGHHPDAYLANNQINNMAKQMAENMIYSYSQLPTAATKTPGEKEYLVPLQKPLNHSSSNHYTFQSTQAMEPNNTSSRDEQTLFNLQQQNNQANINIYDPSVMQVNNLPTYPNTNSNMSMNAHQFLMSNPNQALAMKAHINSINTNNTNNTQNTSTQKNSGVHTMSGHMSAMVGNHMVNKSGDVVSRQSPQKPESFENAAIYEQQQLLKKAAMGQPLMPPMAEGRTNEFGAMPLNEYKRNHPQTAGGYQPLQFSQQVQNNYHFGE